jgi:hypothetical protein
MVILRLIIAGILFGLTYPFLPLKLQWRVRAALGNETAEILLAEFDTPPDDVPDALQFPLENQLVVTAGDHTVFTTNDIRYVRSLGEPGSSGRQWEIHLFPDAAHAIRRQLANHPDVQMWVTLDGEFRISAPQHKWGAGSPICVSPSGFSTDPSFGMEILVPWYERPFLPSGSPPHYGMRSLPDDP